MKKKFFILFNALIFNTALTQSPITTSVETWEFNNCKHAKLLVGSIPALPQIPTINYTIKRKALNDNREILIQEHSTNQASLHIKINNTPTKKNESTTQWKHYRSNEDSFSYINKNSLNFGKIFYEEINNTNYSELSLDSKIIIHQKYIQCSKIIDTPCHSLNILSSNGDNLLLYVFDTSRNSQNSFSYFVVRNCGPNASDAILADHAPEALIRELIKDYID